VISSAKSYRTHERIDPLPFDTPYFAEKLRRALSLPVVAQRAKSGANGLKETFCSACHTKPWRSMGLRRVCVGLKPAGEKFRLTFSNAPRSTMYTEQLHVIDHPKLTKLRFYFIIFCIPANYIAGIHSSWYL